MSEPATIRGAIDWGQLAPLRLRVREVTEGLYAGLHRSPLRGAGIEFGGFREYVAGDDLRWLDRRALLRHDRLLVRQFETDTDRGAALLLDASASMGFRSPAARGAKIAFAAVVAAAVSRVALAGGDPVGLTFVGGEGAGPVGRAGGRDQFERILSALEGITAGGDAHVSPTLLGAAIQALHRTTRRGALVVLLSDLLDWPDQAAAQVASLSARGRVVVVVQTLDPLEVSFPFVGPVRLRSLEGDVVVETDADVARAAYLAQLGALTSRWRDAIVGSGGRFLTATTSDSPLKVVRDLVEAAR
jgi:uncharacterized protein (DUF58 family)